jgi:FkbM family methyltransferase
MGCDNRAGAAEGADQIYRLKNGLSVYHLNKYETDFSYREIFEDSTYLKHGISLEDNACIFDVGANIGLFAIFAKQLCPDAKVFAFEPAPEVCRLLQLNVAKYDPDIQVYQCGLSDKESVTNYTYYPHYSIMSGFHADFDEDNQALCAGVRNQVGKSLPSGSSVASDRIVEVLVKDKLNDARQSQCRLNTVSAVLREVGVDRINLLKIDAERSELEILNGIDECDWPKIDQIVMEAHSEYQAESVVALLNAKGYSVKMEQEASFKTSVIVNIFATRP